MYIILGILLSFSVWALDSFENLENVRILRALPKNILVLNRGLEDGIKKNSHAKLISEINGFSSRALCLRATPDLSYWKIYRVPHSEAFSKDFTYTLVGIADREMPPEIAELKYKSLEIKEELPKASPSPSIDPFKIKRDLPERLTERDLLPNERASKGELFLEKNFNNYQFKKEISHYELSIYASPLMRQSINHGQSFLYGLKGENVGSKYRLITQFEQYQNKLTDARTKESVSSKSTQGQIQFSINQIDKDISTLSLINYNSQYFGQLGTPYSHWQFGPVGLTWHLYESRNWEFINLSYIPLYDLRATQIKKDDEIDIKKNTGLRHGLRLGIKNKIDERIAVENLLWVRPYQDISTWEIESKNLNLVNDFKIIFHLAKNFYFDYNFIFQKDSLWKELSDLPDNNIINSLNLRIDLNL